MMALLALGAAGFAQTGGYTFCVISIFVMGLGYGLVNPVTAKGVINWFEPKRRASAMGIKQTGMPLGGMLASAAAVVVVVVSWRLILWTIAGATVVFGVVWRRRLLATDGLLVPSSYWPA